jgi:protein KTI12
MSSQVPKAPTDALRTLESTTSAIVSSLVASPGGSGALLISYSSDPGCTVRLTLPGTGRTPTLSELQRHKRTFVTAHKKAITLGSTEKGAMNWTESAVAERFARYLEENIKP